MPYRALEVIETDKNPLADNFDGQLLSEGEGSFLLVGKGGILSDADAEKFGLTGDSRVERIEDGQALRENDERNQATYGAGFRVQSDANPANVSAASDADSGSKPEPVKSADTSTAVSGANVIEVTNSVAESGTKADAKPTTTKSTTKK